MKKIALLLILIIIIAGYGGYSYFFSKPKPLTEEDIKKAKVELFYERLNTQNQNIYVPKDVAKIRGTTNYPKHVANASSKFFNNNYQIGVEAIETNKYYDTQLNSHWDDTYGDLFYFEKGYFFRYDIDAYNKDYTEKAPLQSRTQIIIQTEKDLIVSFYPKDKRQLTAKTDRIEFDPKYFGPLLEIYRRLQANEPIFETKKKNQYSFVEDRAKVVFNIPEEDSLIHSIYIEGTQNSSIDYVYHYTQIENTASFKRLSD